MHPLGEVVTYLTTLPEDERQYVKAKHVAADTALTSHEASSRLCHLRDNANIPLTIEKWSGTGSSFTYEIVIEDATELRNYLDYITQRDGEPPLDASKTDPEKAGRGAYVAEASDD